MFSLQAGGIRNALVQAGMSAEQATKIAHILGNAASELRTGPLTTDATPGNLQQVDSTTRKTQLPGFDSRSDDPYAPARTLAETEERIAAERQSDVTGQQSVMAQQRASREISQGQYLDIKPQGDSIAASLRVVGTGNHAYFDAQGNQVVAKQFRGEVGNEDQYRIRLTVDEEDGATVWRAQLRNLVYLPILTTVPQPDGTSTTGVRYAWVWVDEAAGLSPSPLQTTGTMQVVTSVYWQDGNLVTNYANIPVPAGWTGDGGFTNGGSAVGAGTKWKCLASGCGIDPTGTYATLAQCKEVCAGEQPPVTEYACGNVAGLCADLQGPANGNLGQGSVTFSPFTAGDEWHQQYTVPSAAGTVTLQFNARCTPQRFQIWGPRCRQDGSRIIGREKKVDSGWRGDQGNDCADYVGNHACDHTTEGSPTGTLTWAKPAGVTCLEVAVLPGCPGQADVAGQNNPEPDFSYTVSFTATNPAP